MDNLTYFDFIPTELLEIITFYINDYDGLLWINGKYPKILLHYHFWLNKVKENFKELYNILPVLNTLDINRIIIEKILDNTSDNMIKKIELYSRLYKVYDPIYKKFINRKSYEYYSTRVLSNINDLLPFISEDEKKMINEDVVININPKIKKQYGEPELKLRFVEARASNGRILVALELTRRMIIEPRGLRSQIMLNLDDDNAIDLYLGEMDLI